MCHTGPHNLKACLAYWELSKCACLYKSSNFALFCWNVPAELLFLRCAFQIICRMLRIVEVCTKECLAMHAKGYTCGFFTWSWVRTLTLGKGSMEDAESNKKSSGMSNPCCNYQCASQNIEAQRLSGQTLKSYWSKVDKILKLLKH